MTNELAPRPDASVAGELMLEKDPGRRAAPPITGKRRPRGESVYRSSTGCNPTSSTAIRKPGAKTRASVFSPLSLLELVVYHKDRGG